MKLILNTGVVISYNFDEGYEGIHATYNTLEEGDAVIELLNEPNALDRIQMTDDEGTVLAQYDNLEYRNTTVSYESFGEESHYHYIFSLKEIDKVEQEIKALKLQMKDLEERVEHLEEEDQTVTITFNIAEGEDINGTFVTSTVSDAIDLTEPAYAFEIVASSSVSFVIPRIDLPSEFYLVRDDEGGALYDDMYTVTQKALHVELVDGVDNYIYNDVAFLSNLPSTPEIGGESMEEE